MTLKLFDTCYTVVRVRLTRRGLYENRRAIIIGLVSHLGGLSIYCGAVGSYQTAQVPLH